MSAKRSAFLVCVLCLCCALALSGCSGAKSKVKSDLDDILSSVQAGDVEYLGELAAELDAEEVATYGISEDELLAAYLDGFSYEIQGVTKTGDTATVSVVITSKDYASFSEAFAALAADVPFQDGYSDLSDEEQLALFGDALLEALASTDAVEKDAVEFTYEKTSGGWEPSSSFEDDLADALL